MDGWDRRIANWIERAADDPALARVRKAYVGEDLRGLDDDAMPEPYVGDPASADPLDAVILTLNPGKSGREQRRGGSIVEEVRSCSYRDVAKKFLHSNTKGWWNSRSRWPARLLDRGEARVVGIDLIPWHSKQWGAVPLTTDVLDWFEHNVLVPAAAISKDSRLTNRFRLGRPLVLAVGAHHARYLRALGFELLDEANSGMPQWPTKEGLPVSRSIRLYASRDLELAVLQTDAPGGFHPPGEGFDNVVKALLDRNASGGHS